MPRCVAYSRPRIVRSAPARLPLTSADKVRRSSIENDGYTSACAATVASWHAVPVVTKRFRANRRVQSASASRLDGRMMTAIRLAFTCCGVSGIARALARALLVRGNESPAVVTKIRHRRATKRVTRADRGTKAGWIDNRIVCPLHPLQHLGYAPVPVLSKCVEEGTRRRVIARSNRLQPTQKYTLERPQGRPEQVHGNFGCVQRAVGGPSDIFDPYPG